MYSIRIPVTQTPKCVVCEFSYFVCLYLLLTADKKGLRSVAQLTTTTTTTTPSSSYSSSSSSSSSSSYATTSEKFWPSQRVSSIQSRLWCSPSSLLFSSLLRRSLHHPPIFFFGLPSDLVSAGDHSYTSVTTLLSAIRCTCPNQANLCALMYCMMFCWPSVCLVLHSFQSAMPHATTRIPLDGFSWNLIYEYPFRKSLEKISLRLKSDKNYRHFTLRPIYIFNNISLSSP